MRTGRVLAGRYELGDVIGHGGMADVHSGRDLRSGRRVAVKVLRRDLARDPLFRARFRLEAQTLASLDHPAIVSIIDTGDDVVAEHPDAARVPFIVMEHVSGGTLRELQRRGRLSVEESIRHVDGLLSALESSHRAGVVHRDVKPANVMVTPDGTVKLVDFGIARAGSDPAATLTQGAVVLGTPSYLSPEQALGGAGDASSDLYSAGCLLHELLTGRPPFVGDPIAVAYQHVHEEPAPAGTGHAGLDALLVTALAKSPTDRFQSARAFREALQSAASGIAQRQHEGAPPGTLRKNRPAAPATARHRGTAAIAC